VKLRWTGVARVGALWLLLWAILAPIYAFRSTTELRVYVRAAGRLADGEEIYRLDDTVSAFAYPPAFALPFVPLAGLGDTTQRLLWVGANALLGALALLMVHAIVWPYVQTAASRTGRPPVRTAVLFWTLVGLLCGRHLLAPCENQSHDLVILVLVLGGTLGAGRGREALGGACLGVAAALKATPLLFLPVLLWQRRWAASAAMVVALVLVSVTADLAYPRRDGASNFVRWTEMARGAAVPGQSGSDTIWGAWNYLNQNLSDTVYRLTAPPPGEETVDVSVLVLGDRARRILTTALQVLVAIAVFAAVALRRGAATAAHELPLRRLAEAGAIVCGMLLLSPMSSKAHFCLLFLPVAAVTADFVCRRRDPWVGAMLLFVFGVGSLTTRGVIGWSLGDVALSVGSVAACTACLLVAVWRVLWTRPWGEVGDTPAAPAPLSPAPPAC